MRTKKPEQRCPRLNLVLAPHPAQVRHLPRFAEKDEGWRLMPGQNRQHQQGHDVGDLDHGVYGGACCVFVGVAYGVSGY
jgi:hypothetical protein